jgi:hypothetical protein
VKRISYCDARGKTEIPYTTGSDYSGDSVTKCNHRVIRRELERYKGIYDVYGDYGTYGLFYDPSQLTAKGKEIVDDIVGQLGRYPVYDEMALSFFEVELMSSYVEDDGFDDFAREIGHHDDEFLDWLSKRVDWKGIVWECIMEALGDYVIIETGCVPYVRWERIAYEFRKRLDNLPVKA